MSRIRIALLAVIVSLAWTQGTAAAHCDTMDGPVVTAGEKALATGDLDYALVWIPKDSERELRTLFKKIVKAKKKGTSAEVVAVLERYFLETLVRLHRQGEGEPYTGIRPAGVTVDPGIAAADDAIAAGSSDGLIETVGEDLAHGLRIRFADVQKHRTWKTVAEGRAYVHAYVEYIHYVETVAAAISGAVAAEH